MAQRVTDLPDPTKDLYPAKRNEKYVLDRPVTEERINITITISMIRLLQADLAGGAAAQGAPWTVKIDGMVEKAQELDIDDLVRKNPSRRAALSPSLCRGLGDDNPMAASRWQSLLSCEALSSAKYCAWKPSWNLPVAPARRCGLSVALRRGADDGEATNELAFLVTGAYGKPVAKSQGAPIRLAVPWKYGFKSVKSIVKLPSPTSGEELLGGAAGVRIRFLGQRQSGGPASALESGQRRGPRRRRQARADAPVQRLRRVRGWHL